MEEPNLEIEETSAEEDLYHDEARLIQDSAGQAVEIVGYWANVTERKQMKPG